MIIHLIVGLIKKVINCTLNGKDMIIHLTVGLIKKILSMSQYFPKPFRTFGGNINVKVDLSKPDIKNISHVDTSSFALKAYLSNLKTEVDKLDIHKLVPVPVDLSKLSIVVKNEVIKKIVHDKLVAEVNNVSSEFVLKTKYDANKTELNQIIMLKSVN